MRRLVLGFHAHRLTGAPAAWTDAGVSPVWRWLHEAAIRPWQHRTWIFPSDPDFAVKAEPVRFGEKNVSVERNRIANIRRRSIPDRGTPPLP